MFRRYAVVLGLAGAVTVLDQATKFLVAQTMELHSMRVVVPGLVNLVHVRNRGAAFSFLGHTDGDWQRWVFAAISSAAVLLLLFMVRSARRPSALLLAGFGLVMGGALGNLVDRVLVGAVLDFLDLYVGGWHWPAFNVADSAISLGVPALILAFLRMPKEA